MDLEQSHCMTLPSQTNIYSSCLLEWPRTQYHLLVASLHGSVVSLDYQRVAGHLRATTTPIQFLYIPADAEIVSIDCFCQSSCRKPVIGITLVKPGQESESRAHFLNIYGARRDCSIAGDEKHQQLSQAWKSVAEDWQTCDLVFTPLKLQHINIGAPGEEDNAFILSGSDKRVHVYRCSQALLTFHEDDGVRRLFPEFEAAFPACVTSFDVKVYEGQRIVAVGLQTGDMQLWQTDISGKKPIVLRKWCSDALDGPLTSLTLFLPTVPRLSAMPGHSLLATCAVELAAVFHHTKHCGFSMCNALQDSSRYDSVICTCAVDLDGDGRTEVVIGTYGHMLLFYKQLGPPSDPGEFQLVHQQRLSQPVYGLLWCDLVGDGSKQLIVVLLNGVVVFQRNMTNAADRCVQRLKLWEEIESIRDEIRSHGAEPSV
ncbi:KICSTOR complex protein kaptin-like [Sycon ciliatum]|uniref:KICSTOR complex protein kaptin-like n=1 Tax=Sycon ciliatum TaxID=27933 RepID=UPI0020A918AD|eukprot:scpid59395/ scgid6424/ Kaptin